MPEPMIEPAGSGFAITPSDTVDLTIRTRGIYVGVSGNVAAVMEDNVAVTFVGLAAGMVHPFRVRRINSTGTTATSIVGLA